MAATCIGQMDKAITIERLTGTTVDAHGQVEKGTQSNWTPHLKSFAKVRSKGGREFWKVQQVNADVSHVWNCQYSKALAESTPAMRLIHDGVTYEILSVIDIDLAHQEVEIQTKRAV